jgi:hypothetical protein
MHTINNNETLRALTGSRKKRVFIHVVKDGSEQNTASYWDGGSKHTYSVLNMSTREHKNTPAGSYPQFKASYTLLPGEILIKLGTFNGKPATPTIYVQQGDLDYFETIYGQVTEYAYA